MIIDHPSSQYLLVRSFKKYGIKKHKFEIIQSFDFYNKKLLDDLERHYIRVYCSFSDWNKNILNKGLNLTDGGSGYKKSITSGIKMAKNIDYKNRKKSNWRPTEEQKRALSEFHKGRKKVQNERYWNFKELYSKSIFMFDKSGNFLQEFKRAGEVPKEFRMSSVNKCCTGKQVTQIYKNHRFSYDRDAVFSDSYKAVRNRVSVYQYNLKMEFVKLFESYHSMRLLGLPMHSIRENLCKKPIFKKGEYIYSLSEQLNSQQVAA